MKVKKSPKHGLNLHGQTSEFLSNPEQPGVDVHDDVKPFHITQTTQAQKWTEWTSSLVLWYQTKRPSPCFSDSSEYGSSTVSFLWIKNNWCEVSVSFMVGKNDASRGINMISLAESKQWILESPANQLLSHAADWLSLRKAVALVLEVQRCFKDSCMKKRRPTTIKLL